MQHLDNKYGKFLKRNNLLQFTANENWLDEALKIFAEGLICLEYYSDHATPADETPEDKRLTQLKWTIDSELEALTGVRNPPPVNLELLTFCPVTIERCFSLLKPFDYTERYSLRYILLRKYSGDRNMTHEEADKEAKILLDEYKAEHFEKLCEESRQFTEWHEREHMRDLK